MFGMSSERTRLGYLIWWNRWHAANGAAHLATLTKVLLRLLPNAQIVTTPLFVLFHILVLTIEWKLFLLEVVMYVLIVVGMLKGIPRKARVLTEVIHGAGATLKMGGRIHLGRLAQTSL